LQDIANKTYRYYFTDNKVVDPFSNLFVYQIHGSLDLILIQEACELVKGEHDFQNFMCKGTPVKSSVREIFNCQLYQNQTPTNFFPCSGIHYIEFQGNGFLKQMVRLLMGGILNIGLGKKTLDELKKYLEVSMPDKLGPVVPAHGLFLWDMNIKN
jgi:tRNA pseudouridine38-40 synthase